MSDNNTINSSNSPKPQRFGIINADRKNGVIGIEPENKEVERFIKDRFDHASPTGNKLWTIGKDAALIHGGVYGAQKGIRTALLRSAKEGTEEVTEGLFRKTLGKVTKGKGGWLTQAGFLAGDVYFALQEQESEIKRNIIVQQGMKNGKENPNQLISTLVIDGDVKDSASSMIFSNQNGNVSVKVGETVVDEEGNADIDSLRKKASRKAKLSNKEAEFMGAAAHQVLKEQAVIALDMNDSATLESTLKFMKNVYDSAKENPSLQAEARDSLQAISDVVGSDEMLDTFPKEEQTQIVKLLKDIEESASFNNSIGTSVVDEGTRKSANITYANDAQEAEADADVGNIPSPKTESELTPVLDLSQKDTLKAIEDFVSADTEVHPLRLKVFKHKLAKILNDQYPEQLKQLSEDKNISAYAETFSKAISISGIEEGKKIEIINEILNGVVGG